MRYIKKFEENKPYEIEIERLLKSELDESKISYYAEGSKIIIDYVENEDVYTIRASLTRSVSHSFKFYINFQLCYVSEELIFQLFKKLKKLYWEFTENINKYNLWNILKNMHC